MKTSLFLAAALLLACFPTLHAADGASLSFIKTKSGKVYTNCRVFKTDPDGVIISHQSGGAKLLFSDLPDDMKEQLGYDAAKEAKYEADRAEAKRREREELWAYRREVAKAQAAAYTAEAQRQQVIAIQSMAMGGGYGGWGWDTGWTWNGGLNCNPWLGSRHGFNRGSASFATPGGGSGLSFKGRVIHGAPQRNVPLGTPAMGPLTPALGSAGGSAK